MKVIIAAAGTGGHINPGIAIANKIKEKNQNARIVFIGTKNGLEKDLVPRAGYELKCIEAHGISRKISFQNIKNMFKTLKGFRQASKIIKEIEPDIVIGTGGYICGPTIFCAIRKKIPTLLHESNGYPGISVKLLSKRVNTICVGFKEAVQRLPKAKKVVITGNPTKFTSSVLTEEQKRSLRNELGIENNLPIVLAFGGSQGAKSINKALINIIKNNINNNYQLIWAARTETI